MHGAWQCMLCSLLVDFQVDFSELQYTKRLRTEHFGREEESGYDQRLHR